MPESHDRDEDALRAAFASGLPTPPGAPDRASGARLVARRGRRRRTAGLALAAAVVVAAVAIVPSVVGSDERSPAPAPAAPTVSAPPPPADCPAYDENAGLTGPSTLGPEVVSVRLCSGYAEGSSAPAGVLSGDDAAALVALVDGAVAFERRGCADNLGETYRLYFDRADGTSQVLAGRLFGCGTFVLGGVERDGARQLFDTARAAIAAQPVPEVACPTDPVTGPGTGPGELADGAVAVRLCRGPGLGFQPPLDQLTSARVATLAAMVNASAVQPEGQVCPSDGGTGYALLFGYPDGSTRSVTGALYGCDTLRVGDAMRGGAQQVLDAFLEALRDQRDQASRQDLPNEEVAMTCPARFEDSSLLEWYGNTLPSVICLSPQPGGDNPTRAVVMDDDEQTPITGDLQRTGQRRPPTEDCSAKPAMTLVVVTEWGDRHVVTSYCGSWIVRDHFIKPSKISQTRLDRLIAEAQSAG